MPSLPTPTERLMPPPPNLRRDYCRNLSLGGFRRPLISSRRAGGAGGTGGAGQGGQGGQSRLGLQEEKCAVAHGARHALRINGGVVEGFRCATPIRTRRGGPAKLLCHHSHGLGSCRSDGNRPGAGLRRGAGHAGISRLFGEGRGHVPRFHRDHHLHVPLSSAGAGRRRGSWTSQAQSTASGSHRAHRVGRAGRTP